MSEPVCTLRGDSIVLPGIASAHSHAFQRALRGVVQRGSRGSFWSWRDAAYKLATRLDPDSLYAVSRFAFIEIALAGVTAVGEFHYLHHDAGGKPYSDRVALADAVIRAARDVGLRITLLRVCYERNGAAPLEDAQKRFIDASLDNYWQDIDALQKRFTNDDAVRIGVAPHSVRAVSRASLELLAKEARRRKLPLHAHVAEQQKEVQMCLAEYGLRPLELFAEVGALDERFVAVHATHLAPHEFALFGESRACACICRTTERDLGDGLPNIQALVDANARLCVGTDSHAVSDPFEETRAIELDERTRAQARLVGPTATERLHAMTRDGYDSIGFSEAHQHDDVELNALDPALANASPSLLDELVLYHANPRAVRNTRVAGRAVITDAQHPLYAEARTAYIAALRSLL